MIDTKYAKVREFARWLAGETDNLLPKIERAEGIEQSVLKERYVKYNKMLNLFNLIDIILEY